MDGPAEAMRRGLLLLFTLALLVPMPAPASAQSPPLGWEIGFVEADGTTLDETETTVRFWVRNDNLAGDLDLSVEFDSTIAATLAGDESISVGSGRNETFTITITGADVWGTSAGTTYNIDVQATVVAVSGLPLPAPVSSQQADSTLIVPELSRLQVVIDTVEYPVSAGTEFHFDVHIQNGGNTDDAIASIEIEDDCPVLTVDDAPLQALVGQTVTKGTALLAELVFDASTTHPTRECEIEVKVRSQNVEDGGEGEASAKRTQAVQIEARPVGSQQDNDEANVDGDDGPSDPERVTSDNFLPWPVASASLGILLAALARARER